MVNGDDNGYKMVIAKLDTVMVQYLLHYYGTMCILHRSLPQ